MPTIQDRRTIETVLAESKVIAMDAAIEQILPGAARFLTMIMKTSKKTVDQSPFYHREQEPQPRWVTFTAAVASSGTTGYVSSTHGSYFAIPTSASSTGGGIQLLVPRTDEILLVTAETGGTLTFATRGRGGTTAKAIKVGDVGFIMGGANREDSVAPSPLMVKEALKTWYCQVFRDALEVSDMAEAAHMYHGNDRIYQQGLKLIKHKMDLNIQLLFGGSGENYDIDADAVGKMGFASGLLGVITDHVISMSGGFTRQEFWRALRLAGEYHEGDYGIVCGPYVNAIIHSWDYNAIRYSENSKRYGVTLQMVNTPEGPCDIILEKNLRGNHLQGLAFLVPMPVDKFIRFRPYAGNGKNFDTKLFTNIKTEDNPLVKKDEYLTIGGFQIKQQSKFATLTDIP